MSRLRHSDGVENEWKKIEDSDLDIDYLKAFLPKPVADEYFRQFEKEFVYFTGSLAEVRVYGQWHIIPRQQVAYGDPDVNYKFSGNVLPAQPWPDSLLKLKKEVEDLTGFKYNFVLVNRYRNGDDYIAEHKDSEAELDPDTPIASVSLGCTRDFVLKYTVKDNTLPKEFRGPQKVHTIPLGNGDLMIMRYPTNKFWTHSVPRRRKVTGVRVSLTFRNIFPRGAFRNKFLETLNKSSDDTEPASKKAKLVE